MALPPACGDDGKNELIRVTIKDPEQIISFLTDKETVLRLAAGCSINPADVAELLIATEIYQPGITASIMAGLMEFDKRLQREGIAFIHEAISQAAVEEKPLATAFQVVDDLTKQEAFVPRACDLVVMDLPLQAIETSKGVHIPVSEEISIHSGDEPASRKVTYILPQNWTVKPFPG